MGARCYIKKFDNIVNDCSDFFKSISGKPLKNNLNLLFKKNFKKNQLND